MPIGGEENYGGGGSLGVDPGLQLNLNRVIGRTDRAKFLDAQKAANIWAATPVPLDLLGALNYKAGTIGLGLNAVCKVLATGSGKNLDADGASEYFTA